MKRQRVKFPWDLHWENTTYKLKRPISFVLYKKLRLSKKQRKLWTKLVKYFQIKLRMDFICNRNTYFTLFLNVQEDLHE